MSEKLSYLASSLEEIFAPSPEVVVVTGGPAGGKTTGLHFLEHGGVESDRPSIILPEYPSLWMDKTGLNLGELAETDRAKYLVAQEEIMRMSINGILRAKEELKGTDGVVIADRGPADPGAYMVGREEFNVAARLGYRPQTLLYDFADKVIFLRSLAVSYPDLYNRMKGSNIHRYEDAAEQAASTDVRLLEQWKRHPELHIIDTDDEDKKYKQLGRYAMDLDTEHERKWAISQDTVKKYLEASDAKVLNKVDIRQHYLEQDGIRFRWRKSYGSDGHEAHTLSIKQPGKELRRCVNEDIARKLFVRSKYLGSVDKTRTTVYDAGFVWYFDAIRTQGAPINILEVEASSPEELEQIDSIVPGQQTTFSNERFAIAGDIS